MNKLTKSDVADRSKINPVDPLQTKSWSHELGITKQKLLELIEKVGNSAAGVRKELETERNINPVSYRRAGPNTRPRAMASSKQTPGPT
jgi:hypothetical protein